MKHSQISRIIATGFLGAVLASGARDCEALAKLSLPGASITRAEAVRGGSFTPPGGKPFAGLPQFCRVAATLKPSSDSDIQVEVWMPASNWNGKFLGVGNGGFAGNISYDQLAKAVAENFVAASTNTGHWANPATVDASWALGHPEKIIDYGHRAIHEMTVAAKAVARAYYGESPRRSYFNSCSNGGRQALMEAQRYPEDYDGIIAGAPANNWTRLLANAMWNNLALGEASGYIPAKKLPAIQAAALAACDARDGVKDGVIEEPSRCAVDVSTLQCQGAESDSCLTSAQVATLKRLYTGAHTADGNPIFPGYPPGGEAEPGAWQAWVTGTAPEKSLMYSFAVQFFQNMVFDDPAWDYHTFAIDRDMKKADEKMGPILNATNPDLSRFSSRGGKLILYHGWSDAAISASSTIDYYQSVVAKMGAQNTRGFLRLFMVPGMQHCGGGSGPSFFGQYMMGGEIADRDLGAALERWVDHGVAPDQVIAAKLKNNADPKSDIIRTRPLCAYPLIAKYKGSGSTDDAANFACAAPEKAAK